MDEQMLTCCHASSSISSQTRTHSFMSCSDPHPSSSKSSSSRKVVRLSSLARTQPILSIKGPTSRCCCANLLNSGSLSIPACADIGALATPPCFGGRPGFLAAGCGGYSVATSGVVCGGSGLAGIGGDIMGVTERPRESERYEAAVSGLL